MYTIATLDVEGLQAARPCNDATSASRFDAPTAFTFTTIAAHHTCHYVRNRQAKKMVVLKFILTPEAAAKIHDLLICLGKFSETVAIEARRERVGCRSPYKSLLESHSFS